MSLCSEVYHCHRDKLLFFVALCEAVAAAAVDAAICRPYVLQMERAGLFEPLALPRMLEQSMAHIE